MKIFKLNFSSVFFKNLNISHFTIVSSREFKKVEILVKIFKFDFPLVFLEKQKISHFTIINSREFEIIEIRMKILKPPLENSQFHHFFFSDAHQYALISL